MSGGVGGAEPRGAPLSRFCVVSRILRRKNTGRTITLADITEKDFRTPEQVQRLDQIKVGAGNSQQPHSALRNSSVTC